MVFDCRNPSKCFSEQELKKIFPYASEPGVCYTGFRVTDSVRALPRSGSSPREHVDSGPSRKLPCGTLPRKCTLLFGRHFGLQLCLVQSGGRVGLGSDGPYREAATYLAIVVIAQTALTGPRSSSRPRQDAGLERFGARQCQLTEVQ